MKDQRKSEIKVGVIVVVCLLICILIISWAKNLSFVSSKKVITVQFSSVAGLEVGDPVTVNGVRKGYVENITVSGSKVYTKLNLDNDIVIKDDAKFVVMMLDLMGGKKIEITPGNSTTNIDFTKIQHGEFVGDIASAMAMLGYVQNDLVDVIKDVKVSLGAINKTLTDQKFNSDLKTSLENLAQLTNNLNLLIKNNKDDMNKLLKSGNELAENVNSFVQTNRDSISKTISSIQDVLYESKTLIAKVNSLIDQTNASENNLGKILNDKDIVNDLKTTINNAKELTRILVEQLKAKGIEVNAHIF